MRTRSNHAPIVDSEITFIQPPAPDEGSIPEQKEYFKLPTRFGAVPVDEAPLGWEVETRRREVKVTKFQHAYPTIRLPFQEVQRVSFGHGKKFAHGVERERERERENYSLLAQTACSLATTSTSCANCPARALT